MEIKIIIHYKTQYLRNLIDLQLNIIFTFLELLLHV
jgi:hypothetical protein